MGFSFEHYKTLKESHELKKTPTTWVSQKTGSSHSCLTTVLNSDGRNTKQGVVKAKKGGISGDRTTVIFFLSLWNLMIEKILLDLLPMRLLAILL